MDKNPTEKLDIEGLSKKETYGAEEKKFIMDSLNEERRLFKKAEENISAQKRYYSEDEKYKILNELNEKRLSTQQREEIQKRRIFKKQIYKIEGKEFYKFTNMEREYYIKIEDCKQFSNRPAIITLYYKTFSALKKKDVLLKTEIYSDKIFISYNPIRVYFKGYSLEDEK